MNVNGKYIKDESGNIISPIVSTDTVYDQNNNKISDVIVKTTNVVNEYSIQTNNIYSCNYINNKFSQHRIPITDGSTAGWYQVLRSDVSSSNNYQNNVLILSVMDLFSGDAGTLYINVRRNGSTVLGIESFKFLDNSGLNPENYRLGLDNNGFILYQHTTSGYHTHSYKIIQSNNLESPRSEDIITFFTPSHTDTVSEPNAICAAPVHSFARGVLWTENEIYKSDGDNDMRLTITSLTFASPGMLDFQIWNGGILCKKNGIVNVNASLNFYGR